ncbi:MAG: hypothetical protein COW42_00600 [Deltaproteobacteria bacterium CG17_big_fil_post_rev_8_21_14_2_50_63_7]|nr:MAG: hypothetical protein COW42_00600 [Deltaproteobacteria bacterium CG17_big_fil_post_rev_8_21_14_2_50_63_7]
MAPRSARCHRAERRRRRPSSRPRPRRCRRPPSAPAESRWSPSICPWPPATQAPRCRRARCRPPQ